MNTYTLTSPSVSESTWATYQAPSDKVAGRIARSIISAFQQHPEWKGKIKKNTFVVTKLEKAAK